MMFHATECSGCGRRMADTHKNSPNPNIIQYFNVVRRPACAPQAGGPSQNSRLSKDNNNADEQYIETPLSLAALSEASKRRQQSRTLPRTPAASSPSSPFLTHRQALPSSHQHISTSTDSSPPHPYHADITAGSSASSISPNSTSPYRRAPASTSHPQVPTQAPAVTDTHYPSTTGQVAVLPATHASAPPHAAHLHPGSDSETAAPGGDGGDAAAAHVPGKLVGDGERASVGSRAAREEQPRHQFPAVSFNTVEELRQLLRTNGVSFARETRMDQGSVSGWGRGRPVAPAVSFRSAAELRQLLANQQQHSMAAVGVKVGGGDSAHVAAPAGDGGSGTATAAAAGAAHSVPVASGAHGGGGVHGGMASDDDDDDDDDDDVDERPEGCDPWDGAVSGRGSDVGHSWDVTAAAAAAKRGGERGRPNAGSGEVSPEMEVDSEYQKAKRYALSALQRAPLPTAELSRRLVRRGASPQHVSVLLGWLGAQGVLNDGLFARLFAQSKWSRNLMAPGKIQQELLRQGVESQHVTAALAVVFGPSRRIRLTGAATQQEKEVREALLAAARSQVERSSRGAGTGARDGQGRNTATAAAARVKEREGKRRRLAHWLSYRGHSMDIINKVFSLLGI